MASYLTEQRRQSPRDHHPCRHPQRPAVGTNREGGILCWSERPNSTWTSSFLLLSSALLPSRLPVPTSPSHSAAVLPPLLALVSHSYPPPPSSVARVCLASGVGRVCGFQFQQRPSHRSPSTCAVTHGRMREGGR